MDFLPIETTLNRVHQNNVDFLPIEITSKKVRRNNVEVRYFIFDVFTQDKNIIEVNSMFCDRLEINQLYMHKRKGWVNSINFI